MNGVLIQVLQFIMSLSLLVLIHEFGHYITARIFKIRVEKFYIFFNPWFTLYKRKIGQTEYGIGWLPLGGYVSLSGMIDESMNIEQMKEEPKPWEFRTKPAWQRLIVMLAGIAMNILVAMVIYTGMLFVWGDSYERNDDMVHGYVFNEAGHELGFENGDRIIAINGERVERAHQIPAKLMITEKDVTVDILRDSTEQRLTLPLEKIIEIREQRRFSGLLRQNVPFVVRGFSEDSAATEDYAIGDRIIAINGNDVVDRIAAKPILKKLRDTTVTIGVVRGSDTLQIATRLNHKGQIGVTTYAPIKPHHIEYSLIESIPAGISLAGSELAGYWNQLKMIVNPEAKLYKEVGGFISIGSIFPSEWNWYGFWAITAFISIALAVMNLLPIPGLDGGHALFTLWEIITRRKPSDKFMTVMQWIGLILLILLMVYANGNDIVGLFK